MASDATWDELKTRIRHVSEHALNARERLMPRDGQGRAARPLDAPPGVVPRVGAVLLLLYPHRGEPYLPLTVRTASLRNHSGEVSLPGGGFDAADGNVGYSAPRDTALAWAARRAWCAAIGVEAERLTTIGQVHGAVVVRARAEAAGLGARPGSGRAGLGDVLITDETGVVLMTLHADCLPILLADPDRPAVAAVHAGWRGTVADVAGAATRAMASAFGSRPERLRAAFGPAICGACYEVGPEVADAWESSAGSLPGVVPPAAAGGRTHFDLVAANRALLGRAGLLADNVEGTGLCTRCHGDAWFSHRGQGATTGRFGAVIALTRADEHEVVR